MSEGSIQAEDPIASRRIRRLWRVSIGVSIALVVAIAALLYRAVAIGHSLPADQIMTSSAADLAPMTQAYEQRSARKGWEKPIYVPTGVFVQSVEFISAYNVRMTGYIWQRYGADIPADLRRGVLLPEAEKQDLVQAYKAQQNGEELIGWYFVVTIRQPFYYTRYPFDHQDVWLRMWSTDFSRNVVLVPDFASYSSMDPVSKPGIEESFVLEGWQVARSYFGYRFSNYNTNFGFKNYNGQTKFPELFFNVGIQRRILTPLVTQAVSPFVVLVLTFITFLFFSVDPSRKSSFGLSWSGMLGVWSGGFFATLIAQSALRTQVRADSFVFLETLHVLVYPTVLLVTGLATIAVAFPDLKLLGHKDNLITKMLYFPVVLGVLSAVTIRLF